MTALRVARVLSSLSLVRSNKCERILNWSISDKLMYRGLDNGKIQEKYLQINFSLRVNFTVKMLQFVVLLGKEGSFKLSW